MREDLDEAQVVIALGDHAPALLRAAAYAWGAEEINKQKVVIALGDHAPAFLRAAACALSACVCFL